MLKIANKKMSRKFRAITHIFLIPLGPWNTKIKVLCVKSSLDPGVEYQVPCPSKLSGSVILVENICSNKLTCSNPFHPFIPCLVTGKYGRWCPGTGRKGNSRIFERSEPDARKAKSSCFIMEHCLQISYGQKV